MTVVLCSSHLRSLTITYKASFKKIGTVFRRTGICFHSSVSHNKCIQCLAYGITDCHVFIPNIKKSRRSTDSQISLKMKEAGFWKLIFTGRNELRQGNVFTPVGHSVHRRGVCHTPSGQTCDLNSSVRARVSSSRTSFFTPLKLKSEMSTSKICVLTASVATTRCQHYWCTFQGKVYLLGGCTCKHILGVDTADLRFGGVKKLVLELETRARTELFRSYHFGRIRFVRIRLKY